MSVVSSPRGKNCLADYNLEGVIEWFRSFYPLDKNAFNFFFYYNKFLKRNYFIHFALTANIMNTYES